MTEQSAGEWSDKVIADDTDAMMKFVLAEIEHEIEQAKQVKTEAV